MSNVFIIIYVVDADFIDKIEENKILDPSARAWKNVITSPCFYLYVRNDNYLLCYLLSMLICSCF